MDQESRQQIGPLTGGCQCGAVRFRAARICDGAHVCHCRMCQKAVGNLFATLVDVAKADLAWTRGQPSYFVTSSEAVRGFCAACGTPLFYGYEGGLGLCIGAFDVPGAIPITHESGMEGRLPQVKQLGQVPDFGVTEEDMADVAAEIAASNRQHPDHDTDMWPPVSG